MNPDLFLKTKVHIPYGRKSTVPKIRLLARFIEGLQAPLTLIAAPAGFGKTTLAVSGIAQAKMAAGWLSLDKADNSIEAFLGYLVLAFQQIVPGIGTGAQEMLENSQSAPAEIVLTRLINDLAELDHEVVLVLDDYHAITSPAVHQAVSFFLDHCPRAVHLVMITRSDPPIALSRLRARGQVAEFRASDLRFSLEEARVFLNDLMDLRLGEHAVRILEERTEGWITGLQMAALSLRDRQDPAHFIAGFSGTNRYILDYLLEEVLSNQPPEVQHFLLCTAILERMCAPLCDAMLEIQNDAGSSSNAMLDTLERHHLFLVHLDDESCWFRYHHLFSDLLQARLSQAYPGRKEVLHRRAAVWFEREGMAVEAINHALAGGDPTWAARLVEMNTTSLLARGELKPLMSWISVLPDELRRTRPWLCVHQAYALAFAGQLAEVEPLLQQAEQAAKIDQEPSRVDNWFFGAVTAVRAMAAAMAGRDLDGVLLANQARQLLSHAHAWDLSAADWALGYAQRSLGRLPEARAAFEEMIRLAREMGNIWTLVSGLMDLANVLRAQGYLAQARELFESALHEASQRGARSLGYIARMEAGLASVLYEQNQIEEANQHITGALLRVDQWSNPNHRIYALVIQSRLRLAQQDVAGAKAAVLDADAIRRREALVGIIRAMVETGLVRVWLAEQKSNGGSETDGDFSLECLELINGWLNQYPDKQYPSADEAGFISALMLARYFLTQKHRGQALDLLGQVRQNAEAMGNAPVQIEAHVLSALAHRSVANHDAFEDLEAAFSLAQAGGFMRIFLDEDLIQPGRPLHGLLTQWLAQAGQHPAREYARRLLKLLAAETMPDPTLETRSRQVQGLSDPLSQREIEILKLIAQGLTNDNIARQLIISSGTVKAHTAAIYRKLDVTNRTEAVARARQIQILP